ncbi:PBP1A family penicillin-binding protein [uncultured Helicobacter sp.]|uniref:transglycosylase domain-containing protein n=1 Tax=uncultured Helicobacter sp. TaxID=175537 RepID=UPI0026268680|nr:PBP1A family penicillin-binding protein [uncultured Helicobacter sp.]
MWRGIKYSFFVLSVALGIGVCAYLIKLFYDVETEVNKIKNYRFSFASQIVDRKDRLIANVFTDENFRFYATFDEIPPRVIESLLAVEDTLFFEHIGINPDAISRAMLKNIKSMRYVEGGSTLTQQLIKNIILSPEKTLKRKLTEVMLAIHIERHLSKEKILELYLNRISFGHGYHGIKTAALGYFHKTLNELTLKEICMLVGLPKAPSFYDPTKNKEYSIARANDIIDRLYDIGWISKEEQQSALNEVPEVYNQTLTQNVAPYVVDEVLRELSHIEDLKTGGYYIKLNIDLDYQFAAQEALIYGYEQINKRLIERYPKTFTDFDFSNDTLNGAMVVTDTHTGDILALVGGVDYVKNKFNRATQAKRQLGSSIKPFIYQSAFDKGESPATFVPDVPRKFVTKGAAEVASDDTQESEAEEWRPSNYTTRFNGFMTLKDALRTSSNLATINLVDQNIGFSKVYQALKNDGFENLPENMSIVLGSFELSPLQAARQYSLFSNYGTILKPALIESVINKSGENIYSSPRESRHITTAAQAFLTIDILRDVVNRGTGARARMNGLEVAGKTGTSNRNIDAWFCGFTPDVQAIVWYGRDDNTPIGPHESGGIVAPPAFAYFFSKVLTFDPGITRKFQIPEGVKFKTLDYGDFYYTDNSPLPVKKPIANIEEELLF